MKLNSIAASLKEVLPIKPEGATRLLVVSDVHLGHSRVKTDYVVTSFLEYILSPVTLASIDAILITGDLFDKLLNLPVPAVRYIHRFIHEFLKRCAQYNVAIRILEGTPGHDWGQSKTIIDINETYKLNADVLYVDGMDIIEDETLGLTIGYVQDEYRETVERTTVEMEELLTTRGFSQVDIMLMHGQFDFQVPKGVAGVFDSEKWSKWARYGIFIGHNHTHRSHLNIVVPGSLERLAHNEEGPKGFIIADIVNGRMTTHFIKNERSMLFRTVGGLEATDVEIVAVAEKALEEMYLREDCYRLGFLKVKHNEEYDFSTKLKEWRAEYPDVLIEAEKVKPKTLVELLVEDDKFTMDDNVLNIDRENVEGMILRESEECDVDPALLSKEIAMILSGMKI